MASGLPVVIGVLSDAMLPLRLVVPA
jgi:hypothetical protein